MFGLVYTAFVGVAKIISHGKKSYNDNRKRKKAANAGQSHYIDTNGTMREVSTGEATYVMHRGYDPKADALLMGEDGRIIRNISADERNKRTIINKRLAEINGNSVYQLGMNYKYPKYSYLNPAPIYVDFETGDKYLLKNIKLDGIDYRQRKSWSPFYVRINDGMLIRKPDLCKFEEYPEDPQEAIDAFNNKDKKERMYLLELNKKTLKGKKDPSVPDEDWLYCDRYKYEGVLNFIKCYMTQSPEMYVV